MGAQAVRTVNEIRAELASVIARRAGLVAAQRFLTEQRRTLEREKLAAIRVRNIEMLRLFDDEAMNYNAIANLLEMSPHTIKVLLAKRGRSYRLRQMRQAQDKADRILAQERA